MKPIKFNSYLTIGTLIRLDFAFITFNQRKKDFTLQGLQQIYISRSTNREKFLFIEIAT